MKIETLEQIAEKYSQRSTAPVFQEAHKQDFIAGAKWQQEQAKEMDKEQKIEFACQVAEASAMKYIQGKTTWQIAEELITIKSE